jgi:hypothetical protein
MSYSSLNTPRGSSAFLPTPAGVLYRTHASPRRRAFGSRARRRPIAARVVVVVVVVVVRARVVVVARAVLVVVIVVIVVVIAVRVVVVARRAPRSRAASRDAPPIARARAPS